MRIGLRRGTSRAEPPTRILNSRVKPDSLLIRDTDCLVFFRQAYDGIIAERNRPAIRLHRRGPNNPIAGPRIHFAASLFKGFNWFRTVLQGDGLCK